MIFFRDKNKKMNIQIWISHHDSLAGWLPVCILLIIQQLVATLDKHHGFDRCNKDILALLQNLLTVLLAALSKNCCTKTCKSPCAVQA